MDNHVKIITDLVSKLKEKNRKIEALEQEIKLMKEDKKELEEIIIPDTMSELGAQSVTLLTNEIVTIKPFFYARLPQEPEQFFSWLRNNNFGGLIKEKFEVIPDDGIAELLIMFLKEYEITFEQMSTVHWKTLEAWFKECCEAGLVLPTDLFPHYVGRKAQVKT